jgi:hypothetical protein
VKVGVSFFVSKKDSSIWNNGGAQNCIFLWKLLQECPSVSDVYLINGGDGEIPSDAMMLGDLKTKIVRFDEVKDEIDVLIEAGAQIERAHEEHVHARGGAVVAYKFGNAYVIDTERVIHEGTAGSIMNGTKFDEVWTNKQHMHTCAGYWQSLYRCPVRAVPHIWDPMFIHLAQQEMPLNLSFQYKPGRAPKRIAILEPNINIVKTCQIPMLIVDEVYRAHPDLVGDVYVTNSAQFKEHLTFKKFAASLDIVKDGKCSFEHRYNTPWFMASFADVVVSHQWENALNYLYYELLYAGHPLVHSSDMLDAGYYYKSFDVQKGAEALERALRFHDNDTSTYNFNATRVLFEGCRSVDNPHIYDKAITAVYQREQLAA